MKTPWLLLVVLLLAFPSTLAFEDASAPDRSFLLQARLVPSSFQMLGVTSVAVSGDTVIVGRPNSSPAALAGEVFVFVTPPTGWNTTAPIAETATLVPSDGARGFGDSVAISGDTVLVGATSQSNGSV